MATKNNNGGDATIFPDNRFSGDIKAGVDAGIGYGSTDQVTGTIKDQGNSLRYVAGTGGIGGTFTGVYANGTPASPTYVNQNDVLARLVGNGANETGELDESTSVGIIQYKVFDTDPVSGGGGGGFLGQWEVQYGFKILARFFYTGDFLLGPGNAWQSPTLLDFEPELVVRGGGAAITILDNIINDRWTMSTTDGDLVFRHEEPDDTVTIWMRVDKDTNEIFLDLPTVAGTTGSLFNDSGTVKVAP